MLLQCGSRYLHHGHAIWAKKQLVLNIFMTLYSFVAILTQYPCAVRSFLMAFYLH